MAGNDSTVPEALDLGALCWRCQPDRFTFETTDELEALSEAIGQDRAVEAIKFAIGIRRPGYNLFALGPEGIGKHSLVRHFIDQEADRGLAPSDWCYISNFRDPRAPRALQLPAGRGAALQEDMARFIQDLRAALRNGFESDEYRTRRRVLEEELKEHQERIIEQLDAEGRANGIALLRTPMGFTFAPVRDGQVVPPEDFQKLPQDERERTEADIQALQKKLQDELQKAPVWIKATREKVRKLNDETALFAIAHPVAALQQRYADLPAVQAFLEEVRRDVVEHVEEIVAAPAQAGGEGDSGELGEKHPVLRRYGINLMVDNSGQAKAPVVFEDEPSYDRLLGRVEHRAEMGALLDRPAA